MCGVRYGWVYADHHVVPRASRQMYGHALHYAARVVVARFALDVRGSLMVGFRHNVEVLQQSLSPPGQTIPLRKKRIAHPSRSQQGHRPTLPRQPLAGGLPPSLPHFNCSHD